VISGQWNTMALPWEKLAAHAARQRDLVLAWR